MAGGTLGEPPAATQPIESLSKPNLNRLRLCRHPAFAWRSDSLLGGSYRAPGIPGSRVYPRPGCTRVAGALGGPLAATQPFEIEQILGRIK